MKYIEAPFPVYDHRFDPNREMKVKNSVFLAGGITGCPDWQSDIVKMLSDTDLTLLNPRRVDFPIGDPDAAFDQIQWEHNALRSSLNILFWFPCETICPIVLFELGSWSMTDKPIFVGVHRNYARRQDVEIQLSLVRPDVKIVYSLDELANQVKDTALMSDQYKP